MTTRKSRYGYAYRPQSSRISHAGFKPTGGFTEQVDLDAPPGSYVSTANVWIRDGAVRPRSRLTNVGTNRPTVDIPVGFWTYNDIGGTAYMMCASSGTVSYYDANNSWHTLTYASGVSNYAPSGGEFDDIRGTSVFIPGIDENLAVFTNGVDPLYAWAGPSSSTAFSTLTQSPIAKDVTLFDNRIVAWNVREIAQPTAYVQRVQWHVAGDPYDWNTSSVGAGFEDLVDMRGEGTRIFAEEDQMILASDKEIWRGRKVGLPYVFQFSPLNKDLGMAIPRAAIRSPWGIFWLHSDYMVYLLNGNNIDRVGTPIRDTLRSEIADIDKCFFSYREELNQLSLYYTDTAGQYCNRCFTYHVEDQVWTRHTYVNRMVAATRGALYSGTTTWQDLVGAVSLQSWTYNQLLGATNDRQEVLATSGGTVVAYGEKWPKDYGGSSDDTVTAYIQTGAIFAGDPTRIKYMDEVRIDMAAQSASSLSIAVSGSLGGTYNDFQEQVISVQSNSSQNRINMGVSGTYFALRLQSDDTGWAVSRILCRSRDGGESL